MSTVISQTEPLRVVLRSRHDAAREGIAAALYVMESADGTTAKIGALEVAANAAMRLRTVEAKHRGRIAEPAVFPLRIVLVAELAGLALGDPDPQREARWAHGEHLESAVRLVLARRLGSLSAWPEWINVEAPVTPDAWAAHVEAAWATVDDLGRSTP
jgi:hypothetical protein